MGWFFKDVLESLIASPLRTGLTLLSVGTGVLSLSVLLAILGGLQQKTIALRNEIGAEEVWVWGEKEGEPFIGAADVARVEGIFPDALLTGILMSPPLIGPEGNRLQILGASVSLPHIRGWDQWDGRMLDPKDAEWSPSAVVIDRGLASELIVRPGSTFRVGRGAVTVMGVSEQQIILPGGMEKAPYTLWAPETHPLLQQGVEPHYAGILLRAPSGKTPAQVVSRLKEDWASRWPDAEWRFVTAERLLKGTRELSRTVGWVYGSVAGLCLLLGGVTLGSLMTLGVRQRKKEIGIRLAIGAAPSGIFLLFLAEGLSVSLCATALGLFTASVLFKVGWAPESFPLVWEIETWIISLGIALGLGLLFSLWPAMVAVRVAPADAMRSE